MYVVMKTAGSYSVGILLTVRGAETVWLKPFVGKSVEISGSTVDLLLLPFEIRVSRNGQGWEFDLGESTGFLSLEDFLEAHDRPMATVDYDTCST